MGNTSIMVYVVFLLIAVVVGYFVFIAPAQSCDTQPANQMNIGGHVNLALHIHPELSIRVDGKAVNIPANIGLAATYMRPMHTHDTTGAVHIEAPCKRTFTLGEFFSVWNQTFSGSCIFEFCNNGEKSVRLFVNGQQSDLYERLPMNDRDRIEIVYG